MILSGQEETEYFLMLCKLSLDSGTVNWSHKILSLSVADSQSRLFVSLLSSSSLHFQLINFLFWSLSPVSSISPFPYSRLRLLPPSLPFSSRVIFTLKKFPFLCSHFFISQTSWKAVPALLILSKLPSRRTFAFFFLHFCPPQPPSPWFFHTLVPILLHILPLHLH